MASVRERKSLLQENCGAGTDTAEQLSKRGE